MKHIYQNHVLTFKNVFELVNQMVDYTLKIELYVGKIIIEHCIIFYQRQIISFESMDTMNRMKNRRGLTFFYKSSLPRVNVILGFFIKYTFPTKVHLRNFTKLKPSKY